MNKKHFRKPEPEHKLRSMDYKPKDRGDHSARRVGKIPKNKACNETQVKPETKNFFDCLRTQIEAKDLGGYLVQVDKHIEERGDADKMLQLAKKIDDKKVPKSNYVMTTHINNPYGVRLSAKNIRKIQDKMVKAVQPLDIDKRRKLYKMYTFRKASEDRNIAKIEVKDDNKHDDTNTVSQAATCADNLRHLQKQDNPSHVETIEESEEECTLDESVTEDSPTPTSTIDHKVTEGVQTELLRPTSAKKQNTSNPPKKPNQLLLKNRHVSPVRYKRKPIIKTLMTRRGDSTRIYKSVSFVEQKKKAPLKIHVGPKITRPHRTHTSQTPRTPHTPRTPCTPRTPQTPRTPRTSGTPSPSNSQKSKYKALSQTSTDSTHMSLKVVRHKTSPTDIQKLIMNRKYKNKSRRRRACSPEIAVAPPPVTEVAKWAPQSVNDHTKPYYEAWVNTTLTAISSDNEKMRKEKERIIQHMQDRLQFHTAFGLFDEDLSDEKYTGRIKVSHR